MIAALVESGALFVANHSGGKDSQAMLFMSGRIEFVPGNENKHKKARCGAGTVLFAWGQDCVEALQKLSDRGVFLKRS